MKLSTGRWVSGDDFFDRETELRILKRKILEGNHVLLTGQRRMGKTSIVRELGQRLKDEGWIFLFTDVEGANCAEEVISEMAKAVHPIHAISSRIATEMKRWFSDHIDEVSAYDFSVKFRAGLDTGNWRRHGEKLLRDCAEHDKRVLLVIDELPIFLINDVDERITEVLESLVHDGYLKAGDNGYSFPSRLLQDWWEARFRDHYEPLESRGFNDKQQGSVQ
ncbi:MAG: ATP-binding protein [Gammaproteobacteria bacterium]|nr:ATP-binding protein [Gammaproteobacteria bacterium]